MLTISSRTHVQLKNFLDQKDYYKYEVLLIAYLFYSHSNKSCIYLAQGTRFVDTLDDHIQTLLSRKAQRRESPSSSTSPFRRTGSFIFTSSFTEKTPDERHDSVSSADWVKVEDIIATMESLAFHCKQGKRCCTCVITCYRVAQVTQSLNFYYCRILVSKCKL